MSPKPSSRASSSATSPRGFDKDLADLTLLIAAINAWNRLAISLRSEPGHYQSPLKPA